MTETKPTEWRYDPDSRTVYDAATGDAVCIVSDLADVAKVHQIGRRIASFCNIAEAVCYFIGLEDKP